MTVIQRIILFSGVLLLLLLVISPESFFVFEDITLMMVGNFFQWFTVWFISILGITSLLFFALKK